jgi:hypothetical protein
MAWLRLDDKFAQHPKIAGLTDKAFRAHVETMLYCAEYRTEGIVPSSSHRITGATEKVRQELITAGLWDEIEQQLSIHDFAVYNPKDPTKAERQARWRRRQSNGSVDGDVDADVDDDVDGPPTRARARVPYPSSSKDGTAVRDAGDERSLTGSSPSAATKQTRQDPRKVARAVKEAEQVAQHWAGGDSVAFDEKLDSISRAHRTLIPPLERDRLWDVAFRKETATT